jgi:ribosomal-protein-alanine N-acetyltransferase
LLEARPVGPVFPEHLETDRLRLDRLCRDNVSARAYYDAFGARRDDVAEETRYLPWDPLESVGEAADRLDHFERQWEERERAEYLIRPKEGEQGAGEIAGTAGLICEWDKDLAMPAIWLRKPFWGRGYSGERADALLELAVDRLDFGVVAIPLHRDNEKSYSAVERYVERHGGRYEGLLRHHAGRYDEPVDHHRFSISQSEYRS